MWRWFVALTLVVPACSGDAATDTTPTPTVEAGSTGTTG